MKTKASKRVVWGVGTLFVIAVGSLATSEACLHAPRWYHAAGGTTSETMQQAIIFHAKGREELILKVNVKLSKAEKMPSTLGWVITLPTVPDAYHVDVADATFLESTQLHFYTTSFWRRQEPYFSYHSSYGGRHTYGHHRSSRRRSPIQVDLIKTGPYDIHQIQVRGDEAVTALNKWFTANGFETKDPKQMQFFIKQKSTFLCIKIRPADKNKPFTENFAVPPLRISFATPKPYYPLKFSSHQGMFAVDVTMFTENKIDYTASADICRQLGISDNPGSFRQYHPHGIDYPFSIPSKQKPGQTPSIIFREPKSWRHFPARISYARNVRLSLAYFNNENLQKLINTFKNEHRLGGVKKWYINRVIANRINSSGNPISEWSSDIVFDLQPPTVEPIAALKPNVALKPFVAPKPITALKPTTAFKPITALKPTDES